MVKVDKPYRKQTTEKYLKSVKDNGSPCSDLQFNVKADIERDKRVRPVKVFEGYKPPTKVKKSNKTNKSKMNECKCK